MTTLALHVADGPDVLVRVLTTLRRRRCEITNVDYVARDRHHPGRFVIRLDEPGGRAHCVAAWLANLVDVLAVESLDGGVGSVPRQSRQAAHAPCSTTS
jgi:acetolactate synthase small subunit